MRELRLKPSNDDKQRLDQTCRTLLERAEFIKATGQWKSQAPDMGSKPPPRESYQPSQTKLKEPISARTLSTREQIILLEGSKLHGFAFWPWKSDPLATEFELKPGENLFLYVLDAITQVMIVSTSPAHLSVLAKLEMNQNYDFRTCKWEYLMAGRGPKMSCPLPGFETL